ncbi:hypothetical protein [Hydrogenimonas sp.]
MKYLLSIVGIFVLLLALAYTLLFTAPGNGFLKPVIESRIAQSVPVPTELERFVLRPDRFEVALKIGEESRIEAKGAIRLASQAIDASYHVDIGELADLQKLTGAKLNGPFRTDGTIKGDRSTMVIEGRSDVAGSDTNYRLVLESMKPGTLSATISHLQIDKLLSMVDQPDYAEGTVDIKADIESLDLERLDGRVVTKVRDGLVHPVPVKNDFNLSIPSNLTFKADVDTGLKGSEAVSKVEVVTSVANLSSKALRYHLKKGTLGTDYRLDIPNLDRLFFLTNQHMRGGLSVTGDVETSKKSVRATAHSETLGGAIDALFKNGIADVTVKNIQTVALTDMLLYPHVFDSRANAKLSYDTAKQFGTLHAELLNGQILPNKMSFMLQQMANFDITKEVYERTTIDTKIIKKQLYSDLYMKSRLTEIRSQKGLIDLQRQLIDMTLQIKIRTSMLPVEIKGELTSPRIKVKTGALLKSKAKEELEKRLPKELENSPAGELLKGLF